MKKAEAERAAKHVKRIVKKLGKGYPSYADHTTVSVIKSSYAGSNEYGVRLATDATAYDYLYENQGYYVDQFEAAEFGIKPGPTGGHRTKLEQELAKAMKWKPGEHYFENYGGGMMDLF